MHTTEHWLDIDDQLRFILFGLECTFDVEFNVSAVEQMFADAETETTSAKQYEFRAFPALRVWGVVEEHEPGYLTLHVQSKRTFKPSLSTIRERAKYQAFRMGRR